MSEKRSNKKILKIWKDLKEIIKKSIKRKTTMIINEKNPRKKRHKPR